MKTNLQSKHSNLLTLNSGWFCPHGPDAVHHPWSDPHHLLWQLCLLGLPCGSLDTLGASLPFVGISDGPASVETFRSRQRGGCSPDPGENGTRPSTSSSRSFCPRLSWSRVKRGQRCLLKAGAAGTPGCALAREALVCTHKVPIWSGRLQTLRPRPSGSPALLLRKAQERGVAECGAQVGHLRNMREKGREMSYTRGW